VDARDLFVQSCAFLGPGRWSTTAPRVIPTGGGPQPVGHRSKRIGGLIHLGEFEISGGIESVSRAIQAAAFTRLFRSEGGGFTSVPQPAFRARLAAGPHREPPGGPTPGR